MKKLLSCLSILLCMSVLQTDVFAQSAPPLTVQGRVLDKQKVPIQGVTVAEVDADERTVRAVTTDVDGNFAIRISDRKDRLSFSFIGHKTVTVNINERTSFNIAME